MKKHGIIHIFPAPRNPKQNEVLEKKYRSIEELSIIIIMLNESNIPKYFGLML